MAMLQPGGAFVPPQRCVSRALLTLCFGRARLAAVALALTNRPRQSMIRTESDEFLCSSPRKVAIMELRYNSCTDLNDLTDGAAQQSRTPTMTPTKLKF